MMCTDLHQSSSNTNQTGRNVRKRIFRHAPSEDSDQPAHLRSLIRIFTWRFWIANGAVPSCENESSGHMSEGMFSQVAAKL